MPPRSSWKGFIRLSLVSVPVKAFTANQTSAEVHLNQLHAECHNRIRYQKTCPEHGEVQAADIVSGYEYAKGQYVVIDPEEVQKLRPKGDQSIHIHGFVETTALDPLYHAGRTYYLLPDGPVGQKPYSLLRRGMVDRDVHALARVVMTGREQLVLLRPSGDFILMTVLEHDAKIKRATEFQDELTEPSVTPEEEKLTSTLIDASRIAEFDFAAYRDEYVDKLKQIIQAKVDGQEVVQVPDIEEPKIINLMEALKASVARAQAGADGEPVRKKAPSKKKLEPAARGKKSG
jgi:DNA end-binding protein Ku